MHKKNCETAQSAECGEAIDSTDENFNYFYSSNPIKDREAGTMIFKFWRPYEAPNCQQLNLKLDDLSATESD
jgi:hypothetical protein